MIYFKKFYSWCAKHWRGLALAVGALFAYFAGAKRQRDLKINAELEREQIKKELEAIEKANKKRRVELIKAEISYQEALKKLDKKYIDDNSKLEKEKDAEYKKQLDEARSDPEQLNKLLKDMGIDEV